MTTPDLFRSLPVTILVLTAALGAVGSSHAQDDSDEIASIGGAMWALTANREAAPWDDANDFCDALEAGGYSDWRLPTLPELEALFEPESQTGLPAGFALDDCCAWSSTNLVEIEPEAKGVLPDPLLGPEQYYWGLLFPDGIRYYSMMRFPDGIALCTRNAGYQ